MSYVNRNRYVDSAKGIAIFLMLWGHCIQSCVVNSGIDFFENPVFQVIYSFHMPLFMLLSGYLFFYSFSKRNLPDLLARRTQSLLQPILLSSVLRYLLIDVFSGNLFNDITPVFNELWAKYIPSLWFLWSVLAASIVVAIVCKKCTNPWGQGAFLLALMPFVAFFPNATMNVFVYPYFVIGFLFAKYKEKLPQFVWKLKYLSLLLFPVLVCFYEKKHYIYTTGLYAPAYEAVEMLKINAYRWTIGLIGSIFALTVLQIIYAFLQAKMNTSSALDGLSKIGEKSLQIYVLSVPLLEGYLPIVLSDLLTHFGIPNIFAQNLFVYNYIFTFSLAILYSVALYYLVKLLEKAKISNIIFGK